MKTINHKEIEKFSKMAEEWWDPNGKFKPLHKFNPIRIKYIKENIINNFNLVNKKKPLNKIELLDIGNSNWVKFMKWLEFSCRIPPFFSHFRKFFYFFFIYCVSFH